MKTVPLPALLALGLCCTSAACSRSASPPPASPPASAAQTESRSQAAILASSTPLMPRAVTSFGAAELGGFVYAFGGYSGTPHAYTRAGQSGELVRLDPSSGAFALITTSEPTQGATLVSAGGALIRSGGMRARDAGGEPEQIVSIDEVASFTPGASSWRALPPLPAPRSSHAAAVVGDTMFVVGGWQLAGSAQRGTFADTLLAFDLTAQSYRVLPQPFARRALAAAPLDGKLVALGGLDPEGTPSRAVHVFDPRSGSWSKAADLPVDGFGVAAASSGDVLYASARDGVVYALDDVGAGWRTVGKLAFPRFFHQLVTLGGERVLALGGISGMHGGPRIRHVETLDLRHEQPRVMAFVLENPLPARNRQGAFVHDDSLYVFGGNRSVAQHDFGPDDFVAEGARLDLASLSWSALPPLPVARQSMQTLVEGDHALALGGFGHDGKEARAHADALQYDLEQERWTAAPGALPSPRTQFGLASFGGARWVFGGLDFKPEAQGESQFELPLAVLRAAPGEPFRESGVVLTRPRRAFGGALLDGRYYLVGGMAGGFAPVTQCEAYDFNAASWSEIACPRDTRISPQLVALGGKLYLAGGSSAGPDGQLAPNASIEVYDPASNTWSTLLERIPIEPRHAIMLPYGDALLLYSAHDEEGRVHVALVLPIPS